jgi:hypothetical protein
MCDEKKKKNAKRTNKIPLLISGKYNVRVFVKVRAIDRFHSKNILVKQCR